MRQYADATDLPDDAPAGSADQLLPASQVLDVLLKAVVYDTDDEGYPTDPDYRDALRQACVQQAMLMARNGGYAGKPAETPDYEWASVKIGSVSLTRPSGQGTPAPTAGTVAGIPVSAGAALTLEAAGLTRKQVVTYGYPRVPARA